jgi:hypothetical protein
MNSRLAPSPSITAPPLNQGRGSDALGVQVVFIGAAVVGVNQTSMGTSTSSTRRSCYSRRRRLYDQGYRAAEADAAFQAAQCRGSAARRAPNSPPMASIEYILIVDRCIEDALSSSRSSPTGTIKQPAQHPPRCPTAGHRHTGLTLRKPAIQLKVLQRRRTRQGPLDPRTGMGRDVQGKEEEGYRGGSRFRQAFARLQGDRLFKGSWTQKTAFILTISPSSDCNVHGLLEFPLC